MKYIFIILISILYSFNFSQAVFSQTKSATPTNSISQQQIDELKTKIASKVAELKLVEKRGILGTVTDATDTQITLTDFNGDIKNIDVDELTKFYSSTEAFGISDIKKGQTLGVLGLFNKESRRILAREVNDIATPQKIALGTISNIDKENYEITLVKTNGAKYIFEIQDITKSFSFTLDTLTKFGFSKMQVGQTIIAMGFTDKQTPSKILTLRIILLPEINLSSKTNVSNESSIPSTGSGVKLYPITK